MEKITKIFESYILEIEKITVRLRSSETRDSNGVIEWEDSLRTEFSVTMIGRYRDRQTALLIVMIASISTNHSKWRPMWGQIFVTFQLIKPVKDNL